MDYLDDEDLVEGVYDDHDLGGGPEAPGGRRHGGGNRALAGPQDVTFSVHVDPAPQAGSVIVMKGSPPELRDWIRMRPCETGNGKLWTATVPLNMAGVPVAAGSMGANVLGMFGGTLGALGAGGMGRAPPPPLFEVTYGVQTGTGPVRKQDAGPVIEHSPLRHHYYNRARFHAGPDPEDTFQLFIHDEVHLLQSGTTNTREFLARFLQLAQAAFAKKRSLLDKALEELILVHWGENAVPPNQVVMAIAATLGYFRRQAQHSHAYGSLYGDHDMASLADGHTAGLQPLMQEREKEPPQSLIVCRWIVQHCPARSEMNDEEDRNLRGRDREGGQSAHQLQRYTQLGVLQAAETLYIGEKTFEWLKLLNFLPEHALPPPLNASQCPHEEQTKLVSSFLKSMAQVFSNFRHQQAEVAAIQDAQERQKREQDITTSTDLFLRGLCAFCPSVDGLQRLVAVVLSDYPVLCETVAPMVFNRLRSLHFGQNDKDTLKAMIREIPFIHSDECAVALLTNQHHPSSAFTAQEIVLYIKTMTESRDGVRPAGPQLQTAMRRWLMRNYNRPPDRPDRKEDKQGAGGPKNMADYNIQKDEIRDAISSAIGGWHMVLSLPCFKQEEETLRMILFELSQAYFVKDPDPLVVLDCMLELEPEIRKCSSVRQLEVELQRIAIKAVKDAYDASDVEQHDELRRLLFCQPTPFRYIIIEAFIGFKQAASNLNAMLVNEPIWTHLLAPAWKDAKNISDFPLGQTQRTGIRLLQQSASELNKYTVNLSTLHTILAHQPVYVKLVVQVNGDKPKNIPQSSAMIQKFDTEFSQVRVYVKMFCTSANIEAAKLEQLIEEIRENYSVMELRIANSKFEGLPVRPHLPWLFSLRGSDVFSKIWKEVARPDGLRDATLLKQEQVVNEIIPNALSLWEQLAKSIETGTAVLRNIPWCVDMEWASVQHELELLESTAPKTSPWVPRAVELTQAMRLAAKLRAWAPSMLRLRDILAELFIPDARDPTVEELNTVVKQYERMWDMQLGAMIELVNPFKATISMLVEPMQDYTIKAAEHNKLLEWLLRHKSTDDFNRLIALCRPNTDDSLILAAIASLQQTRTFLAEVLYEKPGQGLYPNLRPFLQQLATLNVDKTVYTSLVSVQQSFDPMLELLTTHSRTPGVQACYDLKKISETGHFHVVCSMNESEQLFCEMPDAKFNYEALAELRRQLLMTDIPAELDGATNLPEMLEELVDKFKLLEEYGRCTMELFTLGHFAYNSGQQVLSIGPRDPVDTVRKHLTVLQEKLANWQTAVDDARGRHYFLNYFSVRELCHLVRLVPQINQAEQWDIIWPLLRCVDPQADESNIRKQASSLLSNGVLTKPGASEVTMLNALGEVLTGLFETSKPVVRPLEGLTLKQQLQGDLLIRGMQQNEQGVPVFVCCADEASKVTELVLSIYSRRSRVPEAEELKLCSPHTTLEEIELLLRRFFAARRYNRKERLYCLGNVHLLPYVVQCGTVEALRRLEERFGYADASALVFVSGQQNQMLTNALNQHNLAVSVLPQESLMEAVSKVGEKYHGRQLEAVASNMNGVGKTHHIFREIYNLQKQNGNNPVLHHVEIRETTNISALVDALLRDPTPPNVPTAVHLDLAHILPSHVDMLIFELIVVGMLRDVQSCAVYHRRVQDFFFVEIPNTPSEHTAKQLSFCLILPRTYLRMRAECIDPELPVCETRSDGAIMVDFKKNDNLVLVGKALAAMKKEAFNPKSPNFTIGWTAASTPEIGVRDTYTLLEDVCSSEVSPPSFLVFMNFVKFLGELVRSAEGWNMMNLALLQNFDPGLKHFKHCFFRLLIETSRDFALRQVPKANMTIEALAPPQPQALARALSGAMVPPPLMRSESNASTGSGIRLQRQRSSLAEATQIQPVNEVEVESGGIGRIEVSAYVSRFDQMPAWETCVHPIANFKRNEFGNIVGCNIMSLQQDFLGNFIDRALQNSLNLNDLKLEKDWSKVTHQEAVQLVHTIEGGDLLKKKDYLQGPKDYVVTVDNLLKLMSIQQRLKYGLPVILMGETGCGKTALVKFLAKTLDFKLFTLDIHGGISDAAITQFLDSALAHCNEQQKVLVFFDEINAANCMALFKTIIIDRMYGNSHIPLNCRVISCCNPYRLRRNDELEEVALVFQHHTNDQTTGIQDPMKRLVYRVHPLPESLIDVVNDFGALSEKSEEIYIDAILRKELPKVEEAAEGAAADSDNRQSDYDVFLTSFKELLCQSQTFVREVNHGERSVVSMRDIARAARVFKWFLTYYSKLRGVASIGVSEDKDGVMRLSISEDMKPHIRTAVILTLGYCYHSRLNRDQRWAYRKRLCDAWKKMMTDNSLVEWLKLDDANALAELLYETQHEFVSQMELGDGIALNEALRENLFMLLVSVMNQIPILLIGKPGCSKSLAMGVLQNNLNGKVSKKEFFKSMPAVEVLAYQCSPLSTPDAILGAFQSARQSNLGHNSTIVCVLLDEVGLAEESPHLPLKVLHRELEDLQGIACVGISNWALDAAKMSRCVTLYRPPPTIDDLCVTAEGMVNSANLKGYLRALSEAFFEIYKNQKRADFWGMREFYSTVRVVNADLKLRAAAGKEAVLEPQVLMKTVQRNFGGQPPVELEQCIEEFFERTGMAFEQIPRYTTSQLIQQNLEEPDARHLMLLTKNNAALRLLFESELVGHGKAEVMFGSTFPSDQSDIFVAMNLQRIKSFMQQPISLIMVHCDSLYESLYDLLNQHYMELSGQRYVRIAHGAKAKLCPIHRLFRVIVITEISDAYFRLAPPLLNRFEKQIFLRKDLMTRSDEVLLNRLSKFWQLLLDCTCGTGASGNDAGPTSGEHRGGNLRPIAGYHGELLNSLVFTLRRKYGNSKNNDELYEEAKQMLTRVLTPEAVCIIAAKYGRRAMQLKFGFDLIAEYFEKQYHSDLPSYVKELTSDSAQWCDSFGAQVMVMTYSPVRGKIGHEVQKVVDISPAEVSLHELSSSQDIEKVVNEFYGNLPGKAADAPPPAGKKLLVIHADPVAASLRMIEHCRFVCEKARSDFAKKCRNKDVTGSMFVTLVVHLQRGVSGMFSFDFDSQWHFTFLDSVEPSVDLNCMPSLGSMLNTPLIEVIKNLDFPKLLRTCFRPSLSRLIYPHTRRPEDLQKQIHQILAYLDDVAFTDMVRTFILRVLESTPMPKSSIIVGEEEEGDVPQEECSVGQDKSWFARIATAAHELALAGTFRAALHNRIVVLIGSLMTVLLAHLDRNAGLALLDPPATGGSADSTKRKLWLSLSTASLTSPLSVRLHNESVTAISEDATAQHEVGTDAQTFARPFNGRFPASWFVSKSIDLHRHVIEGLPQQEQLAALTSQYQLSKLHEVGLNPVLEPEMLEDYLHDFTAMHLDWAVRIDRAVQQRILKKNLQRVLGKRLTSVLEVHQLFWNQEKHVAYCVSLLNAVPRAVGGAEQLIDVADIEILNLELLLLVHQTLTEELSDSIPAGMREKTFYREWLTRKMVVSGLTQDFLATYKGPATHEKLIRLKTDAEPRIETLALLLQHVAYPLQLQVSMVNQFLTELPAGKVRHSKTLYAILQLAVKITDAGMENALIKCSSFIESWMLDVGLRDAATISDLEADCLLLICSIAAGLPVILREGPARGVSAASISNWSEQQDCGIATLPGSAGVIPRSSCLNLALLRKLIVSSEGDARHLATQKIEELLDRISKHEQHDDTTFATRYAVLQEEDALMQMRKLSGPEQWENITLEDIFLCRASEASPARMLRDIGKVRFMLARYAAVLCKDTIDMAAHDAHVAKVGDLLQTNNERLSHVCRSMRLHLLKCVERQRGLSYLRGLLAEKPLSETKWVQNWRNLHDIDFEKFIGAALVPKWNPFLTDDAPLEYEKAKDAVYEMMTSTVTNKLDEFAADSVKKSIPDQKRDIGALMMVFTQEPGLLAALEETDRRPPWRSKLNEWIATTQKLPVNDRERMLLRIFAGDEQAILSVPSPDKEAMAPLVISGGLGLPLDTDVILRWRLLGHFASVLVSAPPSSLLTALQQIAFQPQELMSSGPSFLPGMDEDIRNRVMKALLERGENIWKFKSHWYKCSCGYTFFIGECGRPMEEARCPGCGLKIGGRDHNKTKDTSEDDETDRSPAGYMLPTAEKDEKHVSFREIPASSARAIRLLLHSAMLLGIVSSCKNPMPRNYDVIVIDQSVCTMRSECEAKYIADHWKNDWKQMVELLSSNVEDLAATLHNLLRLMSAQSRDDPKDDKATASASSGRECTNWSKLTLPLRNSWEETVEAKYLSNLVKQNESVQELYAKWSGSAEDGKFVAELKESADVRLFPKLKRDAEMPQLWAFRSSVTLDALHKNMGLERNAQASLPVLSTVLQQPLFPVLKALGCLVGVFEWHALVTSHFSGRITRAEAANLRVGEFLSNLPPTDRLKWERAYDQFEQAWHIAWPYIDRYECLEFTENLKKVMVNRDSEMLWCIADSGNEGICPLALTSWLVGRHNELVQVVNASMGYPPRKVSSRLLGQHDIIYYDEVALMRFLRSRCVTYGVGGKLNFDFKQMEHHLGRELSRPEITVELRGFQWLGDNVSGNNELKSVIKQKDLMPDTIERLKAELSSPSLANLCLQKVQMSVSFILKSGGGLSTEQAGEMLLSNYLQTILAENPDSLPSATAQAQVHLWHIDSFVKVLRQIINKDPLENVDPKYRAELPKELHDAMISAKPHIPETLVEVLGNFAEAHLAEAFLGENYPLIDVLATAMDQFDLSREDSNAVNDNLPADLLMKHWGGVYTLLKQS